MPKTLASPAMLVSGRDPLCDGIMARVEDWGWRPMVTLWRRGAACGRLSCVVLISLAVALTCVASALARFQPIEARQPQLAVLHDGVVWVDQGRVLFRGFWSSGAILGGVGTSSPTFASSRQSVALLGVPQGGFAAGSPPARLEPVEHLYEESYRVEGGECTSWEPATTGVYNDFAVAQGELIDAGVCEVVNGGFTEEETATNQPLFIRKLRGGEWHVLRWIGGHYPPILATEGNLLAIGAQLSLAMMRVTILDLSTGRMVARFDTPDGYLAFASPRRLLLSVPLPLPPQEHGAPLPLDAKTESAPQRVRLPPYRLELYSLRGGRLAVLGKDPEVPLVSDMHILTEEPVESGHTLAVRSVFGGPSRRLIGFNAARTLQAIAFRWPAAAVVETTSAPLSQNEVTCERREYHAPSAPFLAIFDLERSERFEPPPPSAHLDPPPGPCPVRSAPPTDSSELPVDSMTARTRSRHSSTPRRAGP